MNNTDKIKEKNLAYGGQALIEGILMRGQDRYAFTVKQPDGLFYKEKNDYLSLGKKIKFFGLPFIRGVAGLFENLYLGMKVLNKSAEIAFPEEFKSKKEKKKNSEFANKLSMFFILLISILFALLIFNALPYISANLFRVNQNDNPVSFNIIAGLIRMLFFFIYLILVSLTKDVKRLFGYHGAEHMTIHTYESKEELILENVKKKTRLHPRCGTSFIFIVFLITIIVFPFFNLFFNTQSWYTNLINYGKLGKITQIIIHIVSHILVGMPIVAGISYELLKLSQKLQKNFIVKIFIAPGLFFQLFTTRKPDDIMIKAGILSLKMVLGLEDDQIKRAADDNLTNKLNLINAVFILPVYFLINIL